MAIQVGDSKALGMYKLSYVFLGFPAAWRIIIKGSRVTDFDSGV